MPKRSIRKRRQSIHPASPVTAEANRAVVPELPVTITTNPLQTPAMATNESVNDQLVAVSAPATNNSPRHSSSLLSKLTDAKNSLFGRVTTNDSSFSSADQNRALFSYILSEPQPNLETIQEFERNGAQMNAVTEESDTIIHLLARVDLTSDKTIDIIDYVIKRGADPSRQNDYGWTAAHYALANRNTDLVTFLLKVMIDVNFPTSENHNGYPSQTQLLHIAARKNESVLIRLLIKTYKARVNVFDEDGLTPLQICCYEDNVDALKALLDNDADFQKGTRLNANETPVSICVKYQNDASLRVLLDRTSNFNWKRYFSQLPHSPLLCDFPTVSAIELLVERGLDINAYDDRSNTLLHYLVGKKDIDYENYIEKFIQISADFNRQNRLGRTPFLEALEQRNFPLLSVFLKHIELTNMSVVDTLSNTALHYCKYLDEKMIYEAVLQFNPTSLNAQNRDGQTPLHDAILCDNFPFAQFLLQQGADVSIPNREGNTPLHLTAREDNVRLCKLLLKHPHVDCMAKNRLGKTPLHLACAHEKANVAEVLISKLNIEQLNSLDLQGRTALHECAENVTGSLARYIIQHGTDENTKDFRLNTVLHLAAEKGNLELVRALTKSSNIDVNQVNADGRSPLGLAILYNQDEISKYFLKLDQIHVQSSDLRMAIQMNNYEMVKLLIEKDRNCLRVRSSTHGDMIIHIFMRNNLNHRVSLETLLSFIPDNELLIYLTESSLAYGDNLLHIAAREDTPNALTCFLNLRRVKFWFWANMMLKKNNENKTPMELANEFKHYAVIKLINSKWKESYEYLSHSLRDGHCGVSPTGVSQAKRQCFHCKQTGFIESNSGQTIRPCSKCNVCLYKSMDNSMQVFLALLFSDESSTIALDIMDSLIVTNEVQKIVHLYLDHIEPWQEFDRADLSESTSLLNQLVYSTDSRKQKIKRNRFDAPSTVPLVSMNNNRYPTSSDAAITNGIIGTHNDLNQSRSSISTRVRADGSQYRAITPLEAIYYHERLDLVTHPLVKGLIKWKWDNYAAKHFYFTLFLELLFLILWTCTALILPFPTRYVYRFPQDIWRCFLWAGAIGFLIWGVVREIFEIKYSKKRYEDYLIWENERKQHRLDLISKNDYTPPTTVQSSKTNGNKQETVAKIEADANEPEHLTINEINPTVSTKNFSNIQSHHSQHHPLPATLPNMIKGKPAEPPVSQQIPIDALLSSDMRQNGSHRTDSNNLMDDQRVREKARWKRIFRPFRRLQNRMKSSIQSYYMYYSLNNLFDWVIYILCLITVITHFIDVRSHTVLRARIHMYVASVTVILVWFRFMVFFRTITISAKTLRSKLVEIKLGELVIMVRMMFDDIIRFLLVFIFLLAPYAFVFFSVFGGRQIIHSDYDDSSDLCESALLYCPINEIPPEYDGYPESLKAGSRFIFNESSSTVGDLCSNVTDKCRILEADGFESFYTLLFSIFRIALVDEIPIDSFNLIDRYFAPFVCGTYLLFTAILSINIFIGLISNALQTEAFSTVEARFLLERIEVILNYEWRLSEKRRLQLQELIHRHCAPLQLNWKDINFDAYGRSRDEQQAKLFANFRQTLDNHSIQFDTFCSQLQERLLDIETAMSKQPNTVTKAKPKNENPTKNPTTDQAQQSIPTIVEPKENDQSATVFEELARIRELVEGLSSRSVERVYSPGRGLPAVTSSSAFGRMAPGAAHGVRHGITSVEESLTQNQTKQINERVTELQVSVNRLHQDVGAIRQLLERISPLSTNLILGRAASRK